jgi:hypothetical protein
MEGEIERLTQLAAAKTNRCSSMSHVLCMCFPHLVSPSQFGIDGDVIQGPACKALVNMNHLQW